MDEHRPNEQKPDASRTQRPRKNVPMLLLLLGLLVMGLLLFTQQGGDVKEVEIGVLNDMVLAGGIEKVTIIDGNEVEAERKLDVPSSVAEKRLHVGYTGPKENNSLTEAMKEKWRAALHPENVIEKRGTNSPTQILLSLVPWILLGAIFWFAIVRQMRVGGGPGNVLNFGRSRARVYLKERVAVGFDDVAGIDEAKQEVHEIVEFLKTPAKFTRIGARIPRGVLLVGPPGCGKTLLAKAIAGEAGVPFFSISGSDFVEMFVGVGASRVRDLFKQARENAPCIIFLDEIDAVGRRRGTGLGGGHDEREQTLNQILVEMDGFDTDQGIILIAATNRPDVLDPALLRPGRFDRQIVIDMPDLVGREAILRVHARKVKLSPAVDLSIVGRATPGFSGADLEAIVNEAALMAVLAGRDWVEPKDFDEARDKLRFGRSRRSRVMSQEDRRLTAYHEAGHALMAELQEATDPLHKVTIVPRGLALGLTMQLPEKDALSLQRKKILADLRVLFGGRVAEELVIGDISSGAQNDIERATELARLMVTKWGMSDRIGPISYAEGEEHLFLGREVTRTQNHSEEVAVLIDQEVKRFLTEAHEDTRKTLAAHTDGLHRVAQALLEYETLTGEEVQAVLAGKDLKPARAAEKEREDRARRASAAKAAPEPGHEPRPATGPGSVEPQGGYAY